MSRTDPNYTAEDKARDERNRAAEKRRQAAAPILQAEAEANADKALMSYPLVGTVFSCPKCAFGMITMEFRNIVLGTKFYDCDDRHEYDYPQFSLSLYSIEACRGVMERQCGQCRHSWRERPLDAVNAEPV